MFPRYSFLSIKFYGTLRLLGHQAILIFEFLITFLFTKILFALLFWNGEHDILLTARPSVTNCVSNFTDLTYGKRLLQKSDTFVCKNCGRNNCFPCTSGGKGSCQSVAINYSIYCCECEQEDVWKSIPLTIGKNWIHPRRRTLERLWTQERKIRSVEALPWKTRRKGRWD